MLCWHATAATVLSKAGRSVLATTEPHAWAVPGRRRAVTSCFFFILLAPAVYICLSWNRHCLPDRETCRPWAAHAGACVLGGAWLRPCARFAVAALDVRASTVSKEGQGAA